MVATYEEKIWKLKQQESWLRFTDGQRVFLDAAAQGMKLVEAMKHAYPNGNNKATVFALKSMLSKPGIQQALSLIGVEYAHADVSKSEALKLLSRHLRKPTLDSGELVKLLSLYSKLAGWEEEEEEEEEVSLDKLVAAVEKKRKQL